MQFQQQYSDKQREIIGPLFQRAQLAIAQVECERRICRSSSISASSSTAAKTSPKTSKRCSESQAIQPPAASPPPSEIGFVDQTVLDSVPKVKTANDEMTQFAQHAARAFAPKMAQARSDAEKQQALPAVQQDALRQTGSAPQTASRPDQARNRRRRRDKKLLLVVDRADVIYGGTDITTDVQNALSK